MKLKGHKKRKYDPRKIGLLIGGSLIIFFIVNMSIYKTIKWVYRPSKVVITKQNVNTQTDNQTDNNNTDEKKVIEEKQVSYIGTSKEGQKYTYDAMKVAEKLSNYDYSNDGKKIVFLTFDDGSSRTVTPKILKILKDNNVKATFFLTGQTIDNGGEEAKKLVKQQFEEGHAIANHSYSHDMRKLYPGRTLDINAFKSDFDKNEKLLKEILGENFSTRVIRCPGGYMSWKGMEPLDKYLDKKGMVSIDWNALNADAEGRKKNAQELADYAIKTAEGKEMVVLLMHDTYGKEETAKALPQIIKYFKQNGYEFKTLA